MHPLTRRQVLQAAGAGAAAAVLSPLSLFAQEGGQAAYKLPPLPYAYDALEPYIDAETMKIHHDAHHQAYINNLIKALAKHPDLMGKPVEELLRNHKELPKESRQAIINNAGGHANHTLFWEIMSKDGGQPAGALAEAITSTFGSLEKLQQQMTTAGVNRFGSGWSWLSVRDGKLVIGSTPNQDSPLMQGGTPILGIDVWEHAYYLKYRNKRPDYVKAWWNVANWRKAGELFDKARQG
jgi:superoxide dismutase, Fe-Mn family